MKASRCGGELLRNRFTHKEACMSHATHSTATRTGAPRNAYGQPQVGTCYLHAVIDDHSRLAYVEARDDDHPTNLSGWPRFQPPLWPHFRAPSTSPTTEGRGVACWDQTGLSEGGCATCWSCRTSSCRSPGRAIRLCHLPPARGVRQGNTRGGDQDRCGEELGVGSLRRCER